MRAPTTRITPSSSGGNDRELLLSCQQRPLHLKIPLISFASIEQVTHDREGRGKKKGSYIFVLYVSQQPEFPVGPLGVDQRLEGPIELLDGHLLLGFLVDGRTTRR